MISKSDIIEMTDSDSFRFLPTIEQLGLLMRRAEIEAMAEAENGGPE